MARFAAAFSRRKSAASPDEFQNVSLTQAEPTSSFRVLERNDHGLDKAFNGGARLARASGSFGHQPGQSLGADDNMFAGLNMNRGSGASNSTQATSNDTSSRHSNTSTAPSSAADVTANGTTAQTVDNPTPVANDQARSDGRSSGKERATTPKSSGSSFLDRAGRTFSFGSRKNASPIKESAPDIPPVPTLNHEDFEGRARGLTNSTVSTATPPKLESASGLDMGGDFGSMFSNFDKTASKQDGVSAPRSLTGQRSAQPAPLQLDTSIPVDASLGSSTSQGSGDHLLQTSPTQGRGPPVPRHRTLPNTTDSHRRRPSDIAEDEDAKLLKESLAASNFLANSSFLPETTSYQNSRDTTLRYGSSRNMSSSFTKDDDNMFESSMSRLRRQPPNRFTVTSRPALKNKVMTPAQFERYRKDKEHQDADDVARGRTKPEEEEEDEINYDDDEDEAEKSKQQAKQRRKQEAHMAVYRQQMMKVTGEPARPSPPLTSSATRPSLGATLSSPQLGTSKSPSPEQAASDDEDDEVPLAILQAHGFPAKNRPPTRLSTVGSNPNLRASSIAQPQPQPPRPGSALGEAPNSGNRASVLPAFARNLPQDPFIGASIARPAVRESLSYGGGAPAGRSTTSLPPGGLVGVIASEERSKAMRRGSPNMDSNNFGSGGANGQSFDPVGGIPHQMMYNQGQGGVGHLHPSQSMHMGPAMPGMMSGMMPQMQPPSLSPGDQAQIQMSQQMSQFMQMQMQFMQMVASNQGPNSQAPPGFQYPQQMGPTPPTQHVPSNNNSSNNNSLRLPHTQSTGDLSLMLNGAQGLEPPRPMDHGMRTMSMVQPRPMSIMDQPGYARSIHASGQGYTPSIAPSERSNVGLPGRYRPVSQAFNQSSAPALHSRTPSTLAQWDEKKVASATNIAAKAGEGSDDDDEEGWEAMRAKREAKKSKWKTRKDLGSGLAALM